MKKTRDTAGAVQSAPPLGAPWGRSVCADGDRAALAAHEFDLFLEAEFLPLQFAEAEAIRHRTAELVLDGAFQMLVADAKFTNAGFDCHDRTSMSDWLLK
jgi:hypothetical protein